MSLPPPEVWRLLPPPPGAPSASFQPTAATAVQSLAARTDLASSSSLPAGVSSALSASASSASLAKAAGKQQSQQQSQQQQQQQQQQGQYQRHVTLHPVLPWVAYTISEPEEPLAVSVSKQQSQQQSQSQSQQQLTIAVQDLETQQVLWCVNWTDVAAGLYGERSPSKLPAASKSLGNIVCLAFLDPSSLYWSAMGLNNNNTTTTSSDTNSNKTNGSDNALPSFCWLVVQTNSRILVLQLRESQYSSALVLTPYSSSPPFASATRLTRQAWLVSHLHEKALGGSVPSSNLLAIDADTWLVGCADGSLKAWDRTTHQPVKSIKGLGKGDWIVQILSANRYSSQSYSSSGAAGAGLTQTKRILTVTKKHSVYLIELEFLVGVTPAGGATHHNTTAAMLEIRPPLARFVADPKAESAKDGRDKLGGADRMMDHGSVVRYDAHRDWILWLVPARKGTPISTVLVWNLQALQSDFLKQEDNSGGGSSSSKVGIFKPDPSLTIQFPAGPDADSALSVLPTIQHAAFSEDTVVCAVATEGGEFYLQAAVASAQNQNATAIATPVMGVNLAQLLQRDLALEVDSNAEDDPSPSILIRVHAVRAQPLGGRPMVLLVTNVGLVVLDVEASGLSGVRRVHFGAGLGSLGKSVLSVQHSEVIYGSLDVLTANPVGLMEVRNPTTVYESPPAMHLPDEYRKRPFRLAPIFSVSPSGLYVCLFWPFEFRYEVLHIPSVLQKVGQRGAGTAQTRNPLVATGTGIVSFAWLGDEDDYALIHAEDVMLEAIMLMAAAPVLVVPTADGGLTMASLKMADVMNVQKTALGAISSTVNVTKAATNVTLSATKAATNVTVNVTKAGLNVTAATVKGTLAATDKVTSSVSKGVKKSLRVFGLKKKKDRGEGGGGLTEETEEETSASVTDPEALAALAAQHMMMASADATAQSMPEKKRHFVELRSLVSVESHSSELTSSIAAATSRDLGALQLRGGNRNPPTKLFGGPVLIVARAGEDEKGHAHFYTRKPDEQDNSASVYVSTGPTLPYPELVAWDDDGRLCAIVIENRVAVYLSSIPTFVLLGAVLVGGTSRIVHVKFVHGVLYCCSWNSVYCVFLGDLSGDGVCLLDTYALASAVVPSIPDGPVCGGEYASFSPPVIPLPLAQPYILGYQSGSLVVSSVRGVQSIPLSHPVLRIGTLLAAGQVDRAAKWFDAVPNRDHEALAEFLERRGHSDLALRLPGLSLETIVDVSMRKGYIGRLEEVVEEYGVKGLRAIDMGRGVSPSLFGPERDSHSVVVCVGAYLLASGKVELTRRLATELLRHGEDGKKDALFLATLLLTVDEADASRLIARAVEDDGKSMTDDWPVGSFVRDHVLSPSRKP